MNESQSQTGFLGTPLGQNQTEFVTCAEHVLVWVPNYILVHAKNLNTLLTKQGTSMYLDSLHDLMEVISCYGFRKGSCYRFGREEKEDLFPRLTIYLFQICKTSQSIKKYQQKVIMFCEQEEPFLTSK